MNLGDHHDHHCKPANCLRIIIMIMIMIILLMIVMILMMMMVIITMMMMINMDNLPPVGAEKTGWRGKNRSGCNAKKIISYILDNLYRFIYFNHIYLSNVYCNGLIIAIVIDQYLQCCNEDFGVICILMYKACLSFRPNIY